MPGPMKTMLALAFAMLATGAVRAEIVQPETDENLQWAAAVEQLTPLRGQGDLGAKLFGAAGGDPAMNGLHTYLAFFDSPGDGWRLFKIGDFLSYRVVAEARGRLTLEIRESVMNQRTTEIGTRTRRLTVTWTAPADGTPPASVSVTPAR
jgi:hypothetical protein